MAATEYPGRPVLMKGALVIFETKAPVPTNAVIFTFNPESLTRRVELPNPAGTSPPQAGNADTARTTRRPAENLTVALDLDAADQLETGEATTLASGLHPALAALELLLYPPSTQLLLNRALSAAGSQMISPAEVPFVVFVWGPLRVVPVRVTSLSITEQAFDPLLNPILARVELGLRVLSDDEMEHAPAPVKLLNVTQHVAKEVLARVNLASPTGLGALF